MQRPINACAGSQINSPPPTYASINKSKKKQAKKADKKHTAAEKKDKFNPPIAPYTQKVSFSSADKEPHAGGKDDPTKRRQKSLDDM